MTNISINLMSVLLNNKSMGEVFRSELEKYQSMFNCR